MTFVSDTSWLKVYNKIFNLSSTLNPEMFIMLSLHLDLSSYNICLMSFQIKNVMI